MIRIQDLLLTAFRASYFDTNLKHRREEEDVGRYMYAPQLAYHLKVTLREERMNQNASAEEMKMEAE